MPVLTLKDAESARNAITKQQQRQIKKLYQDAAKEVAEAAKGLKGRTNISSIMRTGYLNELEMLLQAEIRKIGTGVQDVTTSGVRQVSEAVANEMSATIVRLGFELRTYFSNVPANVARNILTGQVYDSGWSLSQRIWGIEQKALQDIHTVIAKGIAENKPVYDIAKDLERYVNPSARKSWDWNKVYPSTNKKIDYSAQRLARTLTQHAFQQATKECNNPNPFVTGYVWHSALIHGRTCSVCMDRDGQVYSKDSVPMDHPNGLCTIMPRVEGSLTGVANKIADWTESPTGTYPEIDQFWEYLKRS